jgi:hypothetical protein
MAIEEFYIRNESDTEARGPFNFEQLSSLAENGQVTAETLYYDVGQEQWVALGGDAALLAKLFPEKRSLRMKPKAQIASLNQASENAAPIEVHDILAAAEGRSADTREKVDPAEAATRNARLGLIGANLALLLSAAALLAPAVDLIAEAKYIGLLKHPFTILGLVDFVLCLLLALQVVSLYPFVRFRAALGAGLLGLVHYAQGDPLLALTAVAGSVGLYFCTVSTNLAGVFLSVVLALGGMGWFAYAVITR